MKFTGAKIDKIAHNFDIYADLDNTTIQYKFNMFMRKQFQVFDSRQRYSCIMKFLESEIDFDYYMKQGIISEHYPLHRMKAHKEVQNSVNKYLWKLNIVSIFGNWQKYLQPIHFIKKYYGEEFAFYFFFFLNYTRSLFIPAIGGIALTLFNYYRYLDTGNKLEAIDTQYNAVYGILLAIWSSFFVERWRVKEKTMIHLWDLENQKSLIMSDERKY